jgi:short-chain fatty acids transporter
MTSGRPTEIARPVLLRFADRLPRPFTWCIYLTLVCMAAEIAFLHLKREPGSIISDWTSARTALGHVGKGWVSGLTRTDEMKFAFEICLILVTGGAIARLSAVHRTIRLLAKPFGSKLGMIPAVLLVSLVAIVTGLVNWGLSLVLSATLAREINANLSRRSSGTARTPNYAMLAAAAYLGLLVWHGGLSGSVPLLAQSRDSIPQLFGQTCAETNAQEKTKEDPKRDDGKRRGEKTEEKKKAETRALVEKLKRPSVGLRETILSLKNGLTLALTAACLLIFMPLLTWLTRDWKIAAPTEVDRPIETSPVGARESWLALPLTMLLALSGVAITGYLLYEALAPDGQPQSQETTSVFALCAFVTLFIGLFFWGRAERYQESVSTNLREVVPIIIQYPLYSGILGILTLNDSKMFHWIAEGGELVCNLPMSLHVGQGKVLLTLIFFLSMGLTFFVPSGGAKWFLLGPMAFRLWANLKGVAVEIDPGQIVLAIAYGDQAGKAAQPFWLMTVCGITGLPVNQVLALTATCMLPVTVTYLIGLLFF